MSLKDVLRQLVQLLQSIVFDEGGTASTIWKDIITRYLSVLVNWPQFQSPQNVPHHFSELYPPKEKMLRTIFGTFLGD